MLIAALLLLVATTMAALALPPLLRTQIEKVGSESLGRTVRLESVELSLRQLSVTLRGLRVAAADPTQPDQLAIDELHADLDARSLLRGMPIVEGLRIERPRARLTRLAEGRWDIDDILARLAQRPPAPPGAEPQRFALYNLQLQGGELDFDDRPAAQRHPLRGLRLELPFISNLDVDVQVHVQPRVTVELAEGRIDLQGRALPFAPDRASELTLALRHMALDRLWAYLPRSLTWQPAGGLLDTALTLRFAQPPGRPAQLQLSGQATIAQLTVSHRSARPGAPTFSGRTLQVELADVQPLARRVALGPVRLDGALLDLRRRADGQLEVLTTTPAPPASPPATAPSPAANASPGWVVTVAGVELTEAQVQWRDAAVRPATALNLQGLSLSTGPLAWPMPQPTVVRAAGDVASATHSLGRLRVEGEVGPERAGLNVAIDALQLSAFAPYVAARLTPRLEGRLALEGRADWQGGERLKVHLQRAALEQLRVHEGDARGGRPPAVEAPSVRVENLDLALAERRVRVGQLRLERPAARLQRTPDGQLNVARWLVPEARPAAAGAPVAAAAPVASATPWRIDAGVVELAGGDFSWLDEATPAGDGVPHRLRAVGMRLVARGLQWPGGKPAAVQVAAQLQANGQEAGQLEWVGTAAAAPWAVRGALRVERLSARAYGPYLTLPLRLVSAELGWRGDLALAQDGEAWRVNARGTALVSDLDLHARRAGADTQLLAWQSLRAEPLELAMAPGARPRVEVGQLQLEDFFARLVVTEQGRFNLSDLQAPPPASARPGAPPQATTPSATAPGLPLDLSVAAVQLSRGRVDFSDRFIRPNYAAALSELNGRIGGFSSSSREMAPVELSGRVAGTGRLDIRGQLNPSANPLALDLRARATDLELAPLSPYSGKYAGYAIERGKLSVDLAYRIDPDGKLAATNQITLNQLTFGAKTDSPDATRLPVRFALSLLADRNGVIDINLPVSGSINDPEFSVFGLVLRLVGNLLLKAVTSPFSLLAGGGAGTAEAASEVGFEPGSLRPTAEGRVAMETVARALAERPALRLTVTGYADAAEGEARRDELLRQALQDEARRAQQRSLSAAPASAVAMPSASAEAPPRSRADPVLPAAGSAGEHTLLKSLYIRTPLPDKPRNLLGLLRDLPAAEMAARLRAALPLGAPGADPWRQLALERGLQVRDALIAQGLPAERVFLGEPNAIAPNSASPSASPQGGSGTPATEPRPVVRLSLGGP